MRISFCTWVKDWPPLQRTLPINLALTAGRDVEFCILDAGSKEPVEEWAAKLDPRVRVCRIEIERPHFARLYNLAHQMARGDVLVTLDGDNVIGPQYCDRLLKELAASPEAVVHIWSGDWLDGTCGRLAYRRETFERLGGYDEQLREIGFQDLDLRDRAKAAGCPLITITEPAVVGLAIRTLREEKMQHLAGLDYGQVNHDNWLRSQANIAAGRLRANSHHSPNSHHSHA